MALKKGSWSPEEDKRLKAYIKRYGIWNWSRMPEAAGLQRSGKSCRLRWMNYLKPGIRHGNFTRKEEETILRMQKEMGNKWSTMATALPGRTDNDIKNYWNSRLKKHSQKTAGTQSQESNTTVEVLANQNEITELNHLVPNIAPEPLRSGSSDGSMNILDLESATQIPSTLLSQNIDENIGAESFREDVLQSLQEQPLWVENSYVENLHDIFLPYSCVEKLCPPEPISPYGFFNDSTYDLWFNFVPAANMDEFEEPCVLF